MKNKILIVEDNMVNRALLKKILSPKYEISEAEDGIKALEIIENEYKEISAVVLDLVMPKMSGKDLMEILTKSEKYKHLPILIATGEHDEQAESECLKLGAWDFITKPYNPMVLRLRLDNIIGRSESYLMQQNRLMAERDLLTGLYNRRFFMKTTGEMLKKYPEEAFVLIRMDVDQFRLYNSSFGSKAGNELLKEMAVMIKEVLKRNDVHRCTFGRMESDVFCICVAYHKDLIEIELEQAQHYIQNLSVNYRLKLSFGLYVIEDKNMDMESIYANAVGAARICKNNLNMLFAYYSEEMEEKARRAQMYTNEMNRALEEKHFQIYLQPKFSIETEMPCGAEALVRWNHPELGMVSPGEFIPVFEQNGLIVQLDYYMWEQVCKMMQKWSKEGRLNDPISVNISRVSMYNPMIVDELIELTDRYEIPRKYLNLEITESAYMSNPGMMEEMISKMHENGFVILMDDFGSGYSSLNTLKMIDVDILKIDMKFLPTGNDNAKSEKILASVVRMAGWLDMPVIVEGVETYEQKTFLESIGCAYIQGYLYARPMPVEDYEKLLEYNTPKEHVKDIKQDKFLEQFDEIWSASERTGTILKSVAVPFIIVEYANGQIDVLRMNQAFTEMFGNGSLKRYLYEQEYYKIELAVEEAVQFKKDVDCECLFVMRHGAHQWYRICISYIGTVEKTSLVSATFMDVTTEHMLKKEMDNVFGALHGEAERESILVVDDLEVSRAILHSLLEEEYHIIDAADGMEAVEQLEKHCDTISAILLDMVMPNMDGKEFLVRKNNMPQAANIPVIVISTEGSEQTQINMLENGVNDYITKPFVPAVVKKRIKNVLEYNGRFRTMVKEYKQSSEFSLPDKECLNLTSYSIKHVFQMIHFLKNVFEVVRLVDARETSVITIQSDGTIIRKPYTCFDLWNRVHRCENCSSICAVNGKGCMNKFEVLNDEVFYIVSQPVSLTLDKDEVEEVVLELASRVSDGNPTYVSEAKKNMVLLDEIREKLYKDPLTDAYNRKYLDESMFLYRRQNKMAEKVAFIMLDLFEFKQINDHYGHHVGDEVLKRVVYVLNKQIKNVDSLIRYGGDEFIIVLTNCEEDEIQSAIEDFKHALAQVKYGPNQRITVQGDFGYCYTSHFKYGETDVDHMIQIADEEMYEQKQIHREQENIDGSRC